MDRDICTTVTPLQQIDVYSFDRGISILIQGPHHCEPNSTSPHHSSGRQLCYDVSTLHKLQPSSKCHYGLCKETWSTIDSLGIARKRKTHRGRRSDKKLHLKHTVKDICKITDVLPIKTRVTSRQSPISQVYREHS